MKTKRLSMLLAFTSVLLLSGFAFGAGFESLQHHWNFDEGPDWHDDPFQSVSTATVVQDMVGTADATLQNMDGTAFVSGRQYTGLEFDGSNDSLLSAGDLSPVLGGTASLSFWLKTAQAGSATSTTAPGILGSSGVQWGWIDDVGRIVLSVDGTVTVRSANALNDNNWHHVVLTRDASTGTAQIFVDGSLVASATGSTGMRGASITRIGHMQNGSTVLFQGRLDQIHAFNGVVDAATVAALYDNHAPKIWEINCDGETSAAFNTDSVLVSTYAYDAEQDILSVASFTQPDHGTVSVNSDGSFSYSATGGYTGPDAFTAVITDGRGGYTENTINVQVTSASAPDAANRTTTFENFQAIQAGGSAIALSGWRVPRAVDWDSDGDQDLLIGDDTGIWRYENTGTTNAPSFASGVRVQADGSNISLSGNILIALADMTGDGVDDLVAVAGDRKIRVYENTSSNGQVPVYAAASLVPSSAGGDFVLPDQRFDAADWDGDGLVDLIMGTRDSETRIYRNVGSAASALYNPSIYEGTGSGAYNLHPRIFDINRNGTVDYIRGINWGNISFWFDPSPNALGGSDGTLTITDAGGATPSLHSATDGAMIDFADFNGDGVLDILIGGHAGASETYMAYGVANTVTDSIAAIEAIYDAYPTGLGAALSDTNNSPTLLDEIREEEINIIRHMKSARLSERQAIFAQMVAHVGSYSFLQMGAPVDTVEYDHIPSIAGQNLMTMHEMLPDSPTHRTNVANAVGLTGTHREIYLQMGLHVGDNQQATQGQIESVRDFMLLQPRESFPDYVLTLDHYYGNGRGGMVDHFSSTKNTFNFGEGGNVSEWDGDLNAAAEAFYGSDVQKGDYFTFVMGHEVTHSLDGYVNSRANADLWRRKGQWLTLAAGPDVLSSNSDDNNWWDWDVTKAQFQSEGHWDGTSDWWTAWDAYWATGPGSVFNGEAVMRLDVKFFLGAPQEAMATQANHHWAHAEARLIGAIDRYERGVTQGIEPMKANITEVLTFLDWISCGMNKIVMQDTEGVSSPYPRAAYHTTHAWVERNDKGYITKVVTTGGSTFEFELDAYGIVTNLVPGVAQNPVPADGATNVETGILGWTKDPIAAGYDVYMGTNLSAVASATQASPEYLGSTSSAAYAPALVDLTQYYWRIDTTNSSMTVKGPVWSFSTGYIPVSGSSIAINFTRYTEESFSGGQEIGPLKTDSSNWNKGTGQSGSINNLISELGVDTGADVTWQSATLWSNNDGTGDDEHRMASGYIDDGDIGGGKGATVTISNIPFTVYRVYGLFTTDSGSAVVNVNVNDTWALGGNASTTAAAWGSIGDNHSDNGEYWTKIVPGSIRGNYWTVVTTGTTCSIISEDRNGSNRGCITAVIIEELPDADGDGIPDETDSDDDNDGMPDDWEITNGLNPRLDDAAGNPDGDDYDNGSEYLADTLAQDNASFQTFFIELEPGTGDPRVRFSSSAARNYAVEYRDDLTDGLWQDLGPVFSGNGSEMAVPDSTGTPQRYYRLRIQLP